MRHVWFARLLVRCPGYGGKCKLGSVLHVDYEFVLKLFFFLCAFLAFVVCSSDCWWLLLT